MLFNELDEAVKALENPSASDRYQKKLDTCGQPDQAARETCKEIDGLVNGLRDKVEEIKTTSLDSVDSGNSELRTVTQIEAQSKSPESRGHRHTGNISDFHSSQVNELTPPPYAAPTKIKPEPKSSPTSSCTEENTSEDQSNHYRLGLRSSSNPTESQGKTKAKVRGASSTRASEGTKDPRQREIIAEFERQRTRARLR